MATHHWTRSVDASGNITYTRDDNLAGFRVYSDGATLHAEQWKPFSELTGAPYTDFTSLDAWWQNEIVASGDSWS